MRLHDISDADLRQLIAHGRPDQRVHAAFELARRLGGPALGALDIDKEPDPGVRAHWTTVLASFGEDAAVRAIAEQAPSRLELDHATTLVAETGGGDPGWLAAQMPRVSDRVVADFADRFLEHVDWRRCMPVLLALAQSDVDGHRAAAVRALLFVDPSVVHALQQIAVDSPDQHPRVLEAWASGTRHLDTLEQAVARASLPLLEALEQAQRRYPLPHLAPFAKRWGAVLSLVDADAMTAADARTAVDLIQAHVEGAHPLSTRGLSQLGRGIGRVAPRERETLIGRYSQELQDCLHDWWEDPRPSRLFAALSGLGVEPEVDIPEPPDWW